MVSAEQIRDVMRAYVQHGGADRFVLEFSAVAHEVRKNGEPSAIQLANKIQSKLAEAYCGHINQEQLCDWVRATVLGDVLVEGSPLTVGSSVCYYGSSTSTKLHAAAAVAFQQTAWIPAERVEEHA
jgi:hypothetical protein